MVEGTKYDGGKDPWHLAPWDAFRAIVVILAFGANKYADRDWEQGMDWSRVFGALQRHLIAWWNKEGNDPETGHSHLWHAGCCIVFLIAYEIRGIGHDDRPERDGDRALGCYATAKDLPVEPDEAIHDMSWIEDNLPKT